MEAAIIQLRTWHHLACASPTTKALQSVQQDHTPNLSALSSSQSLVPVYSEKLVPGAQHILKPKDVSVSHNVCPASYAH